ncbi:MAG: hypothetical protein ACT4QB_23800 [Gammaproteobacteria bacterium]
MTSVERLREPMQKITDYVLRCTRVEVSGQVLLFERADRTRPLAIWLCTSMHTLQFDAETEGKIIALAGGGPGTYRPGGSAQRPQLLGDHQGAAAGRACQGLEERHHSPLMNPPSKSIKIATEDLKAAYRSLRPRRHDG